MKGAGASHIFGLDFLRFAAAAIVAIFHLGFWRDGHGAVAGFQWAGFGWIGVEVFFTLSGYVIAFSAEKASPFEFARGRIARLVPGIWLCSTITFLVTAAFGTAEPVQHWISTLVLNPFGPWVDMLYWTLTVEVAFYTLVFLALCSGRPRALMQIVTVVGAASATFWVLYVLAAGGYLHGLDYSLLKRLATSHGFRLALGHHGCEFLVGVLIYQGAQRRLLPQQWALAGYAVLGSLLEIACETGNQHVLGTDAMLTPLLAWMVSIGLMIWSIRRNAAIAAALISAKSFVRRLGLITYPLYLIHNGAGVAIQNFMLTRSLAPVAAVCLSFLIVLLLASALSFYGEPQVKRALLQLIAVAEPRLSRIGFMRFLFRQPTAMPA